MSKLNLDRDKLELVRRLAESIILPIHHQVERHSSIAVERCLLKILGVEDSNEDEAGRVNPESKPLVNAFVDALNPDALSKGSSYWLVLAAHHFPKLTPTAIVQKILGEEIKFSQLGSVPREDLEHTCQKLLEKTLSKIKSSQEQRSQRRPVGFRSAVSLTQVHLGSGIEHDAEQIQLMAELGIDLIKLERKAGQSLLDEVPSVHSERVLGQSGTLLTSGYIAKLRETLDSFEKKQKRRIGLVAQVSGLASPELTWLAAVEGADYVVCDPFYGVFFRDINLKRSLIDHFFAYRLCSVLGLKVQTSFEDYSSDSSKFLSSYLASQSLTFAFAKKAGLDEKQITLGYHLASGEKSDDGILYEWGELQLLRELFPFSPIQLEGAANSHENRLVFDVLATLLVGYCIQDLGFYHTQSSLGTLHQYLQQLASGEQLHQLLRSARDEILFQSHGKIVRRARQVFDEAIQLLQKVKLRGLVSGVETGAFLNLAREQSSGLGHEGVFLKARDYLNPFGLLVPKQARSTPERRERRAPRLRKPQRAEAPQPVQKAKPEAPQPIKTEIPAPVEVVAAIESSLTVVESPAIEVTSVELTKPVTPEAPLPVREKASPEIKPLKRRTLKTSSDVVLPSVTEIERAEWEGMMKKPAAMLEGSKTELSAQLLLQQEQAQENADSLEAEANLEEVKPSPSSEEASAEKIPMKRRSREKSHALSESQKSEEKSSFKIEELEEVPLPPKKDEYVMAEESSLTFPSSLPSQEEEDVKAESPDLSEKLVAEKSSEPPTDSKPLNTEPSKKKNPPLARRPLKSSKKPQTQELREAPGAVLGIGPDGLEEPKPNTIPDAVTDAPSEPSQTRSEISKASDEVEGSD